MTDQSRDVSKRVVSAAAKEVVTVAAEAAEHVKIVADEAAEHVKEAADEAREHFNQDREDFAGTEPEVARRNLVLNAINNLSKNVGSYVDTSSELVAVVVTEQVWRNRTTKAIIALTLVGFLAASTLVFFGTRINATSESNNRLVRKIDDCSNPNGECFKVNRDAETERMKERLDQSNRLVDDAVNRVNNNLDQKIAALEAQIAERDRRLGITTNTTSPSRTPTTRSTTTSTTIRTVPTTQPIRRPTTPTTVNILCSLLGIGC